MKQLRIFVDGKLVGSLWVRGAILISEDGVSFRPANNLIDAGQFCPPWHDTIRYEVHP